MKNQNRKTLTILYNFLRVSKKGIIHVTFWWKNASIMKIEGKTFLRIILCINAVSEPDAINDKTEGRVQGDQDNALNL